MKRVRRDTAARRAAAGSAEGNAPAAAPAAVRDLIQRAKEQLEQMIDLNPESLVLVDRAGTVLRANRALVGLLGVDGYQSVIGKSLPQLFAVPDAGFFASLLAGDAGCTRQEVLVPIPGAQSRLLRFSVVGGRDAETLVVIAHDATVERRQAEFVEQALKVEAVRALMGALMHHLNQPLTVVMIRAKLMQQALESGKSNPDELKQALQDISEMALRVAKILKKVEESRDYKTQDYLAGLNILKIDV